MGETSENLSGHKTMMTDLLEWRGIFITNWDLEHETFLEYSTVGFF